MECPSAAEMSFKEIFSSAQRANQIRQDSVSMGTCWNLTIALGRVNSSLASFTDNFFTFIYFLIRMNPQ